MTEPHWNGAPIVLERLLGQLLTEQQVSTMLARHQIGLLWEIRKSLRLPPGHLAVPLRSQGRASTRGLVLIKEVLGELTPVLRTGLAMLIVLGFIVGKVSWADIPMIVQTVIGH